MAYEESHRWIKSVYDYERREISEYESGGRVLVKEIT